MRIIIACLLLVGTYASAQADIPVLCPNAWQAQQFGKFEFEDGMTALESFERLNAAKYAIEQYSAGDCEARDFEGPDIAATAIMRFANGQEYRIVKALVLAYKMTLPFGATFIAPLQVPVVRYYVGLPLDGAKRFPRPGHDM